MTALDGRQLFEENAEAPGDLNESDDQSGRPCGRVELDLYLSGAVTSSCAEDRGVAADCRDCISFRALVESSQVGFFGLACWRFAWMANGSPCYKLDKTSKLLGFVSGGFTFWAPARLNRSVSFWWGGVV